MDWVDLMARNEDIRNSWLGEAYREVVAEMQEFIDATREQEPDISEDELWERWLLVQGISEDEDEAV